MWVRSRVCNFINSLGGFAFSLNSCLSYAVEVVPDMSNVVSLGGK